MYCAHANIKQNVYNHLMEHDIVNIAVTPLSENYIISIFNIAD